MAAQRTVIVVGGGLAGLMAAMKLAEQEVALVQALHDQLNLDQDPPPPGTPRGGDQDPPPPAGSDLGLLPSAQLRMGYTFKKTALDKDNQAVVKQVALKDTTATTTIVDILTANAKAIEKVNVQPLADKKFSVTTKNAASSPLMTGIKINDGEQYTINAEFIFNATSGYASWKPKQYAWDGLNA
mgnify:CR=1 FL=1